MRRETLNRIRYFIEQWVPPAIRDSSWFSGLLLRLAVGRYSAPFYTFKDKAWSMNPAEYNRVYRHAASATVTDTTDASQRSLRYIEANLAGRTVLEVGCGRGYIARRLSRSGKYLITATDIIIPNTKKNVLLPNLIFVRGDIQKLPFADRSFDTVYTTHTLEHVPNLTQAMAELRRVAKKRLIIIVPQERPYRLTANLHLHFFPYPFSFIAAAGYRPRSRCFASGGEIYYCEDQESS